MVNGDVIRTKDFSWNLSANFSYNKNKITELYNGVDEYEIASTNLKYVVGRSSTEFYINRYAGVNPANGDALWYTKDGEITTEFRDSDKVMTGKSFVAPWQGGFGTTLTWKGMSLAAQFSCLTMTVIWMKETGCLKHIISPVDCFMTVGRSRVT